MLKSIIENGLFEGHSQQDLENQFKADSVWERKTSPLNSDALKTKYKLKVKLGQDLD